MDTIISELKDRILELKNKKKECIKEFQYEKAVNIRDQLKEVRNRLEKLVDKKTVSNAPF